MLGLFVHTDLKVEGRLSFDDASPEGKILDKIHRAVVQTQLSNVHSLPTDCPHREKRGWVSARVGE